MLHVESSIRLNEAVDLLNAGDHSRALGIASQLRVTFPTPQALYIELMAMLGLGMLKQTEKLLRKHKDFLEQWTDGVGMSAHVQGRLAMRQGHPEAAVPLFRLATERLQKNQSCLLDYAEALFHTAQFAQAHDIYIRALLMGPPNVTIYGNLAACAMRMQQFDQAFAYNFVAWSTAPSSAVAQQIGRAFLLSDNAREAAKYFAKALTIEAPTVDAYLGMADAMHRLKLYRRAVYYLTRGLAMPGLAVMQEYVLLQALGRAYEKLGMVEEWIPHSKRLLEIEPNNISFLLNMGNAMQMLGRYDEALEWADKAAEIAPEHPDIIYFRGFIHLLQSKWIEGYEGYEWRWKALPFKEKYGAVLAPLQSPMWNGTDNLKGKLVMALCEQGAGDLMQFSIYCKHLVERGATVDLLVPPSMTELMVGMPWIRGVHDNYFKIPPHDYHVSLMTMPLYERTTVATIPVMDVPIITLPEARKRERFSDKFTVGLCWYGDSKHSYDAWRSMPTHFLRDFIAAHPDVQFVSLQIPPHPRILQKYFKAGWLIDGVPGATTFVETAAAMDACDLIITVDTSAAHLAAAMHKPVWMLVSTYADWRWLGAESTTRWYPTMKIFRQKKVHDWRELLQRVGEALVPMASMKPNNNKQISDDASPQKPKPARLKRVVSSTRSTLTAGTARTTRGKRSK